MAKMSKMMPKGKSMNMKEGSPAEMRKDASMAKKAGMSAKGFEGSPADLKSEKKMSKKR